MLRFALALLIGILGICGTAMAAERAVLPQTIMRTVAWSFAEPTPSSPQQLAERLVEYSRSLDRKLDTSELKRSFPGGSLDATYREFMQAADGSIKFETRVVRIRTNERNLTFVQILFFLHQALHAQAKEQDKRYFEGLYLQDQRVEPGVPAYELHLGS